jgi:nitrate reductase gamma subunit
MFEIARGPLVWIAAAVFLVGIALRIVELLLLTKKRERIPWPTHGIRSESRAERKLQPILAFRHSLIGKHPVMAIVAGIFHTSLFAAPIFAMGHTLLLRQAWGISLWSLSSPAVDTLTIIVMLGALFMLVRRLVVPRVRAVTGVNDFIFLFIAAAPYLTGFLAYHQWFDYRAILTLHMLAGELMLVAIPFTKLGHMIIFFFFRGLVGGEHSIMRGNRVWSA